MSNRKYLDFLLLYICFLTVAGGCLCRVELQAADLHAIFVGDTDALDLTRAIQADLYNMHEEVATIADYTGLQLKETHFVGESARTQAVLSAIDRLVLKTEDVVIFYFSGHGYRTKSKGDNPWPNLFFTFENKGINLNRVINVLKDSPAHLVFVISDCCNNIISDRWAPLIAKELFPTSEDKGFVAKNYKKLFLNTKGRIIATAAKIDQSSLALRNGSIFTTCFLKSLHNEVAKSSMLSDWQSILDHTTYAAQKMALNFGYDQDAVFLIEP